MLRRTVLLATLALGACSTSLLPEPGPSASLPRDATNGAGDPLQSAIMNAASSFGDTDRLAGRPELAARALAQMEYITIEVPQNVRFTSDASLASLQLVNARREWRAALGIPESVPPQPVINALFAAARAIEYGQGDPTSALTSPIFSRGGAATLAQLRDLPPLPRTNGAAVAALDAMRKVEGTNRGRF